MAKAEVVLSSHTESEIYGMVEAFSARGNVKAYSRLYGGYSGSNYAIGFGKGPEAVLKVCNGYNEAWVDGQCVIQDYIANAGYQGGCRPFSLKSGGGFVAMHNGTPACLLAFVTGKAADKVVSAGISESVVLEGVGGGLGQLHGIPTKGVDLRTWRTGGACLVAEHFDGTFLQSLEESAHSREHAYMDFYRPRVAALVEAMKNDDLPTGVLHGDPFLDNVLVDEVTGAFSGWVDWEDCTVGPLVFDVACVLIGSCFDEGSSELNMNRVSALLRGYVSARPLEKSECEQLLSFMKLTLLCNASWRFRNFNVDHREVLECRDSYVELRDRILVLEERGDQLMQSALATLTATA